MAWLPARLIAALGLVLATCSLGVADEPRAVREADAARQELLRALIAAAAREGELSYWDTIIQPNTHAALVAAFRDYYGLPASFKVSYSLAIPNILVTRVEQELAAGRVTMDVVAVASLPWVYDKIKAGQVMPYDSPQYRYYRAAFDKGLGRDGYFAFNGAYVFVPMWNTDKLPFKGVSWKDVIGAVPSARMSMGDVANSLTYLSTYMGLKLVLEPEYFKHLAQMRPVFLGRSELIANQLVTGQNLLAFSGMPTRAYQVNQRGAKLKFLLPKEGVVLLPQAMFILAAAPHPAAAKLWIDFILSDIGQKIMVNSEAVMSGRSGFVSPIPDYAPAIESLNVIKIDWNTVSQDDMEKARQEWISIFNP